MTAPTSHTQRAIPTPHIFGTAAVARMLGVVPQRVRAIVRAGLCQPRRSGRALQFNFQDLVVLRTAHGLLLADVPPRRVRQALSELARQLPSDRPLSGVRIYADGRHVVVRDGRTVWRPESGQVVFTFKVDDLARAAGRVVPVQDKVKHARRARVRDAQDAAAWFERALMRERRDDPTGACAAYHRAIEIDPDMADAYINLGRLVHGRGDAAEAARLYHLALACDPDDPIAHYNLAIALEDQHGASDAIAHYERAIGLDPEFADAHFNLGRLLDRLGRRSQALRHLLQYKRLTESG